MCCVLADTSCVKSALMKQLQCGVVKKKWASNPSRDSKFGCRVKIQKSIFHFREKTACFGCGAASQAQLAS